MLNIKFYGVKGLSDLKGKTLLFTPKLDLSGIVDDEFLRKHYHQYAYIPHKILTAIATDKRLYGKHTNYTYIHSKDINKHINTRFYSKVIDDLIKGGIIERSSSYIKGKRPKGYRFTTKYAKFNQLISIVVPDKVKSKASPSENNEVLNFLNANLRRLELDNSAFDYAVNCYSNPVSTSSPIPFVFTSSDPKLVPNYAPKDEHENLNLKTICDIVNLCGIATGTNKEVFQDGTSYRVHSILTRLRKDLRRFLSIRDLDEDLVLIDLCNSQVFLVNLLLRKEFGDFNTRQDLKDFYKLTSSGQFYEFLMEKLTEPDRDKIKKEFFSHYFFCRLNNQENRYSAVMSACFPSLHSLVIKLKKDDHSKFAVELQRVESNFFIDRVVPRLMKELPVSAFVSTIHDSILTNQSSADLVEEILKDEFAKDDLRPTFKTETLTKINSEHKVTESGCPPFEIEFVDGGASPCAENKHVESEKCALYEQNHKTTLTEELKIRSIRESFTLNGWDYKLIFREKDIAIYSMKKKKPTTTKSIK